MKVGEKVIIESPKYGKGLVGLEGIVISDIRELVVKIYNGMELKFTADEVKK